MMVIEGKSIYIHMPKTGGKFVHNLFRDYYSDKCEIILSKHSTVREVIDREESKVTNIRNPFSWYVSLYFWRKKNLKPEQLRQRTHLSYYCDPSQDFKIWLSKMFDDDFLNENKDAEIVMANGEYTYGKAFLRMLENNSGYMTEMWKHFCFDEEEDSIDIYLHQEKLNEELIDMFEIDPNLLPRVHVTDHKPYKEYYDNELKEMVLERDREIFEKFGYDF
jgi:hypothetical protein